MDTRIGSRSQCLPQPGCRSRAYQRFFLSKLLLKSIVRFLGILLMVRHASPLTIGQSFSWSLREPGNWCGSRCWSTKAPDFTGTVSEWYETLIETINDVSAQIHRKTLRGGANFIVCGPEVANILEFTAGFRASVTAMMTKLALSVPLRLVAFLRSSTLLSTHTSYGTLFLLDVVVLASLKADMCMRHMCHYKLLPQSSDLKTSCQERVS